MIGAGNLNPVSAFVGGGTQDAALSMDFSAAQLFPASDTLIATLLIDVDGLTPGFYSVTSSFFVDGDDIATPGVSGGFTISAVPEPSAAALLGVIAISTGTVVTVRKRFRRGTTDQVA